ncbi:hypothetical protein OM076_39420 [Solirubrobacter ginsenosidimutans]|uniref:Uncharacterized protein n=1 Tax=Solirubrobacter ginsenosidimutans TaxID=490573 RepID=A0A9X3N0H1_9ACTN|nr:hypothetical protein [Solirubrobacter ginsenosidimutans]MDA0166401.1 hypothetical protein [Solirubrobacter ginsenosidimutans]
MTCPCGHDEHRVPTTRDEIVAAMGLRNRLGDLLETVADDSSKWMSVMRCRECGRYWADDSLDSGHATLMFVYPIETGDPQAWLAQAQNVWA